MEEAVKQEVATVEDEDEEDDHIGALLNNDPIVVLIYALDSEVRAIHMVFDDHDITPIEKIKRLERRFRDLAVLVEDAVAEWFA